MNQDLNSECNGEKGNATMQVFQCPLCSGHSLSVNYDTYGMVDIVGVRPDGQIVFGRPDEQGRNFGTCHCVSGEGECAWEGEFYRSEDGCFDQHLIEIPVMRFVCPKCSSSNLRFIRQGHSTSYPVSVISSNAPEDDCEVTFEEFEREDHGGNGFFGCGNCHSPLTDEVDATITKKDELIAWLKSHQ